MKNQMPPPSTIEESAIRYKYVTLAASILSIFLLLRVNFFNLNIFLLSSVFIAVILLFKSLAKERPRLVFVVHSFAILLLVFTYHKLSTGDERLMSLMNVLAGSIFSFCFYGFMKRKRR